MNGETVAFPSGFVQDNQVSWLFQGEETDQQYLIEKLQTFPMTIPPFLEKAFSDEAWKNKHGQLIENVFKLVDIIAKTKGLLPETARKIYKAIIGDTEFASKLERVPCTFGGDTTIKLYKFLFHTFSPFSRGEKFENLFQFAGNTIPCGMKLKNNIEVLNTWLQEGTLDCHKLKDGEYITEVIQLLMFANFYRIDALKNELLQALHTEFPSLHFSMEGSEMISISYALNPSDDGFDENKLLSLKNLRTALNQDIQVNFKLQFDSEECVDDQSQMVGLIRSLQPLSSLTLCGHNTPSLSAEQITAFIQACGALHSFVMEECPSADKSHVIKVAAQSGDKLQHLRFHLCGKFDDEALKAIADNCPNFEGMWLNFGADNDYDVTRGAVEQLVEKCQHFQHLRLYNSALASPCDGDAYNLGILNILEKKFPRRDFKLQYPWV